MMIQHSFRKGIILVAVSLCVVILGGGLYVLVQKNSLTETVYTCPDGSIQFGNNSCPDSPKETEHKVASSSPQTTQTQNDDWKTLILPPKSGLVIEYPDTLRVVSNESAPIVHVELESSASDSLALISMSAANIINENQDLSDWLKSYDYFKDQYRLQAYESYKRKDGIEVLASFGNTESYDDAFIRVGTTVLYIKNGVNENTKARQDDFREIIERIKIPANMRVEAIASEEFSCITSPDALMTLYWGTQYRKINQTVPFIYAPGSYCESSDGSKLVTMGYFDNVKVQDNETQAIVLFGADQKIVRAHKDNFCHTVGDFGAPLISTVEQGSVRMFCLSGDGGYTVFNVYQAPIETLIPVEVKSSTPTYDAIKTSVEELYDIDF